MQTTASIGASVSAALTCATIFPAPSCFRDPNWSGPRALLTALLHAEKHTAIANLNSASPHMTGLIETPSALKNGRSIAAVHSRMLAAGMFPAAIILHQSRSASAPPGYSATAWI